MQATDPGIIAVPVCCFEQAKDAAARWKDMGSLRLYYMVHAGLSLCLKVKHGIVSVLV